MKAPRRLEFGLSDAERREREVTRRARNCFVVIMLCLAFVGMLDKYIS